MDNAKEILDDILSFLKTEREKSGPYSTDTMDVMYAQGKIQAYSDVIGYVSQKIKSLN
jgi:chemotaxis regulatin CheY-phosphate phosphatase CheZ